MLATSNAAVVFPRNLMRRSAASASASAPCRGLVHDSWLATGRVGGGLENTPDNYVMVWIGCLFSSRPMACWSWGVMSAASLFVQVLTVVGGYGTRAALARCLEMDPLLSMATLHSRPLRVLSCC